MCERESRANRGMTRHWYLSAGRKDSHPVIRRGMFRRKDKGGFRECHFQRDALHDIRVEALRIQEHRELIAGQRTISEYIKVEVVVLPVPQHSHSLTDYLRR